MMGLEGMLAVPWKKSLDAALQRGIERTFFLGKIGPIRD
jgi:hypothetical protein